MEINFKKESFFDHATIAVVLLILLLVPFTKKFIPILIGIWSLVWIFRPRLLKSLRAGAAADKMFLFFIAFYLLHVMSLLYTSNKKVGLFDLEVKFALFLIPLLMFTEKKFFRNFEHIIKFIFVYANIVAALACFVLAFIRTLETGENHFVYSYFSAFHHPSYASMFALTSIGVIVLDIIKKKPFHDIHFKFKMTMKFTAVFLLYLFIYLLGSRTGIITAIVASAFFFFYFLILKRKFLLTGLVAVIILTIPFFLEHHPRFKPIKEFYQLSKNSVDHTSKENVTVRYLIILKSLEIIQENPIIGVGTGDIKIELMKKYHNSKITEALETKLNVHNQYLETYAGIGISGFILLLILVFYPMFSGIRNGSVLPIFFSIIIGINFTFESMLNTQAGVIFFAFFNSLIYFNEMPDANDNC